ncbi:MAG TPA: hypothetical protein DIT25_01660 [Candidatus Moranbacteria bacterium]|nr:hypothetical protein [Candidatus Moranbacteria bacterium]
MAQMSEIVLLASIISLILLVSAPSLKAFMTGAPILYSPVRAAEEALVFARARPGEKFIDLGMGNGRTLVVASDKFGLDVGGYELSPIIFWIAKINLRFRKIRSARLYLKNFYDQDLSQNDIIFCFLTPHAMDKLKIKFEKELKPGTRVISYAFRIKEWRALEVLDCGLPGKIFIYKI